MWEELIKQLATEYGLPVPDVLRACASSLVESEDWNREANCREAIVAVVPSDWWVELSGGPMDGQRTVAPPATAAVIIEMNERPGVCYVYLRRRSTNDFDYDERRET